MQPWSDTLALVSGTLRERKNYLNFRHIIFFCIFFASFSYFLGSKIDKVMCGGHLRHPPAYQLSISDPKKYEKYTKNIQKSLCGESLGGFFAPYPRAPRGNPLQILCRTLGYPGGTPGWPHFVNQLWGSTFCYPALGDHSCFRFVLFSLFYFQ